MSHITRVNSTYHNDEEGNPIMSDETLTEEQKKINDEQNERTIFEIQQEAIERRDKNLRSETERWLVIDGILGDTNYLLERIATALETICSALTDNRDINNRFK